MSDLVAPSSPPRRRFVPEPMETTRSSKRQQHIKPATEHLEDVQDQPQRGNREPEIPVTPEPPASEQAKRRFAPEPVETTIRTSRKKFAPVPVESSTRSSKDKKQEVDVDEKSPARRKFVPEPVETTSTSSRRRRRDPEPEEEDERWRTPSDFEDISRSTTGTSSSSRKFKPEVIEVARASYRKDKTSSGQSSPGDKKSSSPPESPETSKAELAEPHESRFSAAALAKRNHQKRKHSFQVPDLPIIESDSSDEKNIPELSDISSSASDTDQSSVYKGPTYHAIDRKPGHGQVPKITDKELANRMLAAYINERPYEPVAHFAADEDDDSHAGKLSGINGIDIRTFRRDSGTEHDWELLNMQKHHEQLEKMKQGFKADTAGQSRFSAAALAARHHGVGGKKDKKKRAPDEELKKMRSAASPPMLGDDIVFPLSISPKMTRCDVDQVPRPRTNEDHEYSAVEGDPMLWQTNSNVSVPSSDGLWGGFCHKTDGISRPATPMRSGLQTPAIEAGNPFESPRTRTPGTKTPLRRHKANAYSGSHFLPLTPPHSAEDIFTASIDKKLNAERDFDEQFPSAVITQIYNYISLGYPVLAHGFDEELSKISRIPVHELRRDDENTDAKGHVNVPEGFGADEETVTGRCKRWQALRLYCKEWYRQSPQMVEKIPQDWGSNARLRRGSWNR